MSWSVTTDGFGKARLKAFQSLLQSKIDDLNECFENDSTLAFLGTEYPELDSTNVIRGDYEAIWDIKTKGPLRIFVSAGGHREGVDLTQQNFFVQDGSTPGGRQRFYSASITCLFHQSAFNILPQETQTTAREDAYQTVMDWIDFDCFGTTAAIKLSVASNCFNFQIGHDYLSDTKITQAMKCFVATGPGMTATCTGIQATITGYT